MSDLDALQERLGCAFHDAALLRLALTHPSVAHEHGGSVQHNQRLEFLGDAVLQLILTRKLYERFACAGEGPLTKARARLVNRRHLAEQGRRLDLGAHLVLSRGEELHGGRERPSTLADAFEALVGAVFVDAGFDAARQFVLRRFQDELEGLTTIPNLENPKGELQELLQADSAKPRNTGWSEPPGQTTTGSSSARCFIAGWNWAAGVAKARRPPRAKRPWAPWKGCGPAPSLSRLRRSRLLARPGPRRGTSVTPRAARQHEKGCRHRQTSPS